MLWPLNAYHRPEIGHPFSIIKNNNKQWQIDWGLMAISAQIGYIIPMKNMLQLKK